MSSTILTPLEKQRLINEMPAGHRNADDKAVHFVLKPGIMVVIPCYNEEVSVGSLVLRARNYADHVVVVDDGSADKTAEIARLAGAEVIRHPVNKGKGEGIKTAFEYAMKARPDVLVLIDGDGQHNPDEIPLLAGPILRQEADMVNGSRFLVKKSHKVPLYRRIGQDLLTLVTNAGSGQKITDSQNGFRAFARSTFDCFSFKESGMGIESEMLMDAAGANLRIKEVQIDVRYDVDGSTHHPIVHGFSVLGSILNGIIARRSTMAYGLPGIALLVMGTITLSLDIMQAGEITTNLALGYTTLSVLFIITGMLCIFMLLSQRSMRKYLQKS